MSDLQKTAYDIDMELIKSLRRSRHLDGLLAAIKRGEDDINAFWKRWGGPSLTRNQSYSQANMTLADSELRNSLQNNNDCVKDLICSWLRPHIVALWPHDNQFLDEDKFWQLPLATHLLGGASSIDQRLYPDLPMLKRILESHNSEPPNSTDQRRWETVYNLCQAQASLNMIDLLIRNQTQGLKPVLEQLIKKFNEEDDIEAAIFCYDELTKCFKSISDEISCLHHQLAWASKLDRLHFLAVEAECETDEQILRFVLRATRCRREALSRAIGELADEICATPPPAELLKALKPIDDERDREIISSLIENCKNCDNSHTLEENVPVAACLLRHINDSTSPSDDEMEMLKHFSWGFINRLKKSALSFGNDLAKDKCHAVGSGPKPNEITTEPLEEPMVADASARGTEKIPKANPLTKDDIKEEALVSETSGHLELKPTNDKSETEASVPLESVGLAMNRDVAELMADNSELQPEHGLQDIPAYICSLRDLDLADLFEVMRPFETLRADDPKLDAMERILLDRRDTAAFYWMTKARNSHSTPTWLAELVHLGLNYHWRFVGIKERFSDLLVEAQMGGIADCSMDQLTLAAAAIIRPVLMEPDPSQVGLLSVLKRELVQYGLATLWDELLKLAQRGHTAAGEQTLISLISQNGSQRWHQDLSNKTDIWFETARRRKMPFAPATMVWRRLTEDNGALGSLILKARAGGKTTALSALSQEAKQWKDKAFVTRIIHSIQTDQKSGGKVKKIDYMAKDAILTHTDEAISLANAWILYHQQNTGGDTPTQWGYQHQILDMLAKIAKGVIDHIGDKKTALPAQNLLLSQLLELSDKYNNLSEHSSELSGRAISFLHSLDLNLRLIRIPGAIMNGQVGTVSLPVLLNGLERDIDEAAGCQEHLAHGQYLLAAHWLIAAHLRPELPTFRLELEDAVKKYVLKLKGDLDRLRDKVEGKFYCGAIAERNRDDLSRKLDELNHAIEPATVDILNLDALGKIQTLEHAINHLADELNDLVKERDLGLKETLKEIHSKHKLPPEANNFIMELLKKGEIGAANDHLATFRDQLEHNGIITLPPVKKDGNYTSLFFSELGELASSADPFKYVLERRSVSTQDTAEAREYWGSWLKLTDDKGLSSSVKKTSIAQLTQILRWLGFTFERDEPFRPSKRQGAPYFWSKFDLTDVCIKSDLPRWGSQALGRHTLILGWSDHVIPPDEIIRAADSHPSDNSSVIFMCFSRLDENARKKLGHLSRTRKQCPLVIDHNLMAWLCNPKLESLDRSQAMFQIGLAGGSYNPYTPEVAGAVPSEMFFGRQEAIEKLWDMAGSCLVYGGRQLGKSALLQQVRERYHRPDSGEYVLYTSAYSDTSITDVVIKMLKNDGPPDIGRLAPANHKERIRDYLKGSARRIVLLIDESDNLLDADRKTGFKGIDLYRDLMQTTSRRFKIVLAGLHSVQRYQRYPNNPLAHFGSPMCIGPLSPGDAYELIVKPMEIIGIHFEHDSLVYRVLSLTNYHPSLIQLFCSALVQQIQGDAQQQGLPPLTVNEAFIDKIYRRADLRESIKKRFDWTLDLDKRYRVIGYTMAWLELCGAYEGPGEGITASRALPDLYNWWPDAFQSLDLDTVESLMTEMVGLGLLSQVKKGFRLRNSNVIRLLGGEESVTHELELFKTIKYEEQGGAEALRRLLPGPTNNQASPLLFHQESDIRSWGTGVELVTGSRALGLGRVEHSLRSNDAEIDSKNNPSPDIYHLEGTESCQRQVERLKESYRKLPPTKRLIFILDSEDNPHFWPVISEVSRWMDNKLKSSQRYLRLVGLVHPDAYLELMLDDPFAGHPWPRIHHLTRWNEKALDYYFSSRNLAGDKTRPLLERTGGWDVLLMAELMAEAPQNLALPVFAAPTNSSLFDQTLKCILADWKDESLTLDDWADILAESLPNRSVADSGRLRKMFAALADLTLLTKDPDSPDKEAQYKLDQHYLLALERESLAGK